MIKVGLIGESPYDTDAIRNLLATSYQDTFQFIPLLRRVTGSQLDSIAKIKQLIRAEVKSRNDISLLIFIRDLDALGNDHKAINERHRWFKTLQEVADNNSLFLLNIYELEALILADLETFNALFRVSINFKGDPMKKERPKEFLMEKTRKQARQFRENDNPEIFKNLNFGQLQKNCRYFKQFIAELDKIKN